jgi:hypothetical protein
VLAIAQLPRISQTQTRKAFVEMPHGQIGAFTYDVLIRLHALDANLNPNLESHCIVLARNVTPMRRSGATAAGRFIRLALVFGGLKKTGTPN